MSCIKPWRVWKTHKMVALLTAVFVDALSHVHCLHPHLLVGHAAVSLGFAYLPLSDLDEGEPVRAPADPWPSEKGKRRWQLLFEKQDEEIEREREGKRKRGRERERGGGGGGRESEGEWKRERETERDGESERQRERGRDRERERRDENRKRERERE